MDMTNVFTDGVLRELWDDTARTYTAFSKAGVQTDTRPYTAEENTMADIRQGQSTQVQNKEALLNKARTALTNNNAFLSIATPTTAQAVAQTKALTRQMNALIKLIANDLASQDGT